MDNYQIADVFSLLSKLTDIHGDNAFKAKSYAAAAFTIEKLPYQLSETSQEKIAGIRGIGISAAQKISELLTTGELVSLNELVAKTPTGIIEMLNIKGLGPKKISVIWKEMQIENIGELLYACEENRLKRYKGFGEKTQENIRENIEFYLRNQGIFLYAQADTVFPQIIGYLEKLFAPSPVKVTGAFRKQDLTVEELAFVVNTGNDVVKQKMTSANPPELLEEKENELLYKLSNGLKIKFQTGTDSFTRRLFESSGSPEFLEAFQSAFSDIHVTSDDPTDEIYFEKAGIQFIEPCLRETAGIIDLAKNREIPAIIQPADIRGIIHSHSNWSDGSNTIEEMARAARDKGLEYLVISDHSKSAFYANGLSEERIREQQHYIDELNAKLAPFRIFKSIECDILNDGSLDYSNAVLSTFDLVIASVHSNLKMNEEKAMARLISAIENPYTTILGHLTGRLLLSRKGYPVDHHRIIDACAANQVVIELNAHPSRLDIDWKHIGYALKNNVLISINPDAHEISGFDDTRYGVLAAQKGMLTSKQNLSSFTLKEFEAFLEKRKSDRKI